MSLQPRSRIDPRVLCYQELPVRIARRALIRFAHQVAAVGRRVVKRHGRPDGSTSGRVMLAKMRSIPARKFARKAARSAA
jgi:hypothetical protein